MKYSIHVVKIKKDLEVGDLIMLIKENHNKGKIQIVNEGDISISKISPSMLDIWKPICVILLSQEEVKVGEKFYTFREPFDSLNGKFVNPVSHGIISTDQGNYFGVDSSFTGVRIEKSKAFKNIVIAPKNIIIELIAGSKKDGDEIEVETTGISVPYRYPGYSSTKQSNRKTGFYIINEPKRNSDGEVICI